jgi:dCTP deaminase
MIMCDKDIKRGGLIRGELLPAVSAPGHLSFGVDSASYDCRLDYTVRVLRPECAALDPKEPLEHQFETRVYKHGQKFFLPAHGFALGLTMETFEIPSDVLALTVNKSTLARVAIVQPLTKWEPGWVGQATLELCNLAPVPVAVYPGEGICSVVFFYLTQRPERTYPEKGGKYQGAAEIQSAM